MTRLELIALEAGLWSNDLRELLRRLVDER
jgi:hypothetical protein